MAQQLGSQTLLDFASARPSRLILIGVWLIFAPTALGGIVMGLSTAYDAPDMGTAIIASIGPAFYFMLAAEFCFYRRDVKDSHKGDVLTPVKKI